MYPYRSHSSGSHYHRVVARGVGAYTGPMRPLLTALALGFTLGVASPVWANQPPPPTSTSTTSTDFKAATSSAYAIPGPCNGMGLAGQALGGGAALSKGNRICDLWMAQAMALAAGNVAQAEDLAERAYSMTMGRTQGRWFRFVEVWRKIPLLGVLTLLMP